MKVLIFANIVPSRYSAYEVLLEEIHLAAGRTGDVVIPVLGGQPCKMVVEKWSAAGMSWDVLDGWTKTDGVESPWALAAKAPHILRKYQPDVAAVHFGNELPAMAARLGCRSSLKWVWEQDQQIRQPTAISKQFSKIRLVGMLFDRLVAMYEGGRGSLLARVVPSNKIRVIHNSIRDHNGQVADIRHELGLKPESKVLFSTCSLIPRKRIGFLVNALSRVMGIVPEDLHLVVAGSGPERQSIVKWADDLAVPDRVHLVGQRPDARSLLAGADIYVQASIAEAASYAVIEAMCAALPVVMTDAGAAREQVEDGVSGYVLQKDDMDGFVTRLAELVRDEGARRRMGAAGRERWSRMFRVEDAALKYVELYREAAGRR
jgi:glycosyltransferase involved in cell wall biosynthesis